MKDFSRSVLLPIDMQQAFDGKAWPKSWNASVDQNGKAVLRAWRKAALPIIHVQHNSAMVGSSLAPGHSGNNFRSGFEPIKGEQLVTKSVNSAFIGTDLELRLRRMDVRKIVTFGIATDMCVSTTFRMGSNLGYEMLLVEDACNCFELPDGKGSVIPARAIHEAHVATLGFEFGKVTTTAELLAEIEFKP